MYLEMMKLQYGDAICYCSLQQETMSFSKSVILVMMGIAFLGLLGENSVTIFFLFTS